MQLALLGKRPYDYGCRPQVYARYLLGLCMLVAALAQMFK